MVVDDWRPSYDNWTPWPSDVYAHMRSNSNFSIQRYRKIQHIFFVNKRGFFHTVSKDLAFLHQTFYSNLTKKWCTYVFRHCIILHNSGQGALYSQILPGLWSYIFACWFSSDISEDTKTSKGIALYRGYDFSLYLKFTKIVSLRFFFITHWLFGNTTADSTHIDTT